MKRYTQLLASSLLAILPLMPVAALAATNDCDSNAVIRCGVDSKADLIHNLVNGDGRHSDIGQIYQSMGISRAEIASSRTVNGRVTRGGRVIVGDQTVATGATSLGRQDLPGSTKSGSLFSRPTSVSFQQDSLPAYVYMKSGQFQWAVIKSCGNPVVAKPVMAHAQFVPTPQPAAAPMPAPVQIQTVIVHVPAPVVVPAATPPAPALPRSGANLALLPLVLLATAGSWCHYSRQRLHHSLRLAYK